MIVTHEEDIAGHAKRIIRLRDGRILSDSPTHEDVMHQDYLRRAAVTAVSVAKRELGDAAVMASVSASVSASVAEFKP